MAERGRGVSAGVPVVQRGQHRRRGTCTEGFATRLGPAAPSCACRQPPACLLPLFGITHTACRASCGIQRDVSPLQPPQSLSPSPWDLQDESLRLVTLRRRGEGPPRDGSGELGAEQQRFTLHGSYRGEGELGRARQRPWQRLRQRGRGGSTVPAPWVLSPVGAVPRGCQPCSQGGLCSVWGVWGGHGMEGWAGEALPFCQESGNGGIPMPSPACCLPCLHPPAWGLPRARGGFALAGPPLLLPPLPFALRSDGAFLMAHLANRGTP